MNKRIIILYCTCVVIFIMLYVKISTISLDDSLKTIGAKQSALTITTDINRGGIYDCNFKSLVQEDRESIPQLAQHVVGYCSDNNGINGIEKQYNDFLISQSQNSTLTYTLDALGNPLKNTPPQVSLSPHIESGVVLTIDKRIQEIIEEIGNKSIENGAIVVLDPNTSHIKASASFPTYSDIEVAMDANNSPLINRAYSNYSIGSIFKLVTCATALESQISTYLTYDCKGSITLKDTTFSCHKKTGHGKINMSEAIAVSCNPYFIELSKQLDSESFLNMASDLSFGKNGGHLPQSFNNLGDLGNFSFGQGELTATPVQVAQMIGAILNGGNTILSTTTLGTTSDGKTIDYLENNYPTKAMSTHTANILKSMMVDAVMNTENQNAKPIKTNAGGKTSTAQTGEFVDGVEKLNGWFSGFFPVENPRYVVVVLVEDATNGNHDASPIFSEIADKLSLL